jgi:hypothetical protein
MRFHRPAFMFVNILIRQDQLNQIDHVHASPFILGDQVLDT